MGRGCWEGRCLAKSQAQSFPVADTSGQLAPWPLCASLPTPLLCSQAWPGPHISTCAGANVRNHSPLRVLAHRRGKAAVQWPQWDTVLAPASGPFTGSARLVLSSSPLLLSHKLEGEVRPRPGAGGRVGEMQSRERRGCICWLAQLRAGSRPQGRLSRHPGEGRSRVEWAQPAARG